MYLLKSVVTNIIILLICVTNLYGQTWVSGQQLTIDPKTSSVAENDVVTFRAFARTSRSIPVARPLVQWILRDTTNATLTRLSNFEVRLVTKQVIVPRTTWLIGAWSTLSGTFRDSVQITFVNRLPWRDRQQVIIMPPRRVLHEGDTLNLQAYARTSARVPVSNPSITWRLQDTAYGIIRSSGSNTARLSIKSMIRFDSIKVYASWRTLSGTLTDSAIYDLAPRIPPYPWPEDNLPWWDYRQKLMIGPQLFWIEGNSLFQPSDSVPYKVIGRGVNLVRYPSVDARVWLGDTVGFRIRQVTQDSGWVYLRNSMHIRETWMYAEAIVDGVRHRDSVVIWMNPVRLGDFNPTRCYPNIRRSIVPRIAGQPQEVIITREEPTGMRYGVEKGFGADTICIAIIVEGHPIFTQNGQLYSRIVYELQNNWPSDGSRISFCPNMGINIMQFQFREYLTWQDAVRSVWNNTYQIADCPWNATRLRAIGVSPDPRGEWRPSTSP